MTTRSSTTKEALEPCPLCRKPLAELTNGLAYCHNLKTDSLSVDDWIVESCPLAQRSVQLPIKVWHALNSHVSAPTVVDDLLRDAGAIYIVNDVIAGAQVVIRFSELKDAQRLHKALAESRAPASTVAPQQSQRPRAIFDAGFAPSSKCETLRLLVVYQVVICRRSLTKDRKL